MSESHSLGSDVKLELPDDKASSQALNTPDEQPAKRPRLETDGHGPTLSSSYRPRKRPDPIPTHLSIDSPTTSSSTSSKFPSEHIVTPLSSSSISTSTNFQHNNHYRPNSSSSSSNPVLPLPSSSTSIWSDVKSPLPPPSPSLHALPPRPQVSLPPPDSYRIGQPLPSFAVPRPISPVNKPQENKAGKADVEAGTTSTGTPAEPPSAEEIRRRADEVIARLMGTASSPATAAPVSVPASSPEGSIKRKAEDVIARLERETRAREAAVPAAYYQPPYPPHAIPGRPPAGYYTPGAMMPPRPPPGWRPPVGYGPPPGWRPPGPTITRFPRPPPTPAPAPQMSPHHQTPPNVPPHLPLAASPSNPANPLPSPNTRPTPSVQSSPDVTPKSELPVLLPKKRKSESLEPPAIQPKPQNQVYIGNLPAETQLATLRKAFEALSPILTIELRAPYAMIEFEEDGVAQRAVEVYDEGSFGGVQIRVERASD